MNIRSLIFPTLIGLFSCTATIAIAQPRYAPAIRAQREAEWMRDSLGVSPAVAAKDSVISQRYNEQMDKASELQSPTKDKKKQQLMRKKDADIKALLHNNAQYQRYMRRERELRRIDALEYTGPHQPR
jgi:hypothetical protein